ncbi:hypothetical protein OK016_04230 [Vibrio chagasii]|nr:hypothetical protein [Vibrio chagasii]
MLPAFFAGKRLVHLNLHGFGLIGNSVACAVSGKGKLAWCSICPVTHPGQCSINGSALDRSTCYGTLLTPCTYPVGPHHVLNSYLVRYVNTSRINVAVSRLPSNIINFVLIYL